MASLLEALPLPYLALGGRCHHQTCCVTGCGGRVSRRSSLLLHPLPCGPGSPSQAEAVAHTPASYSRPLPWGRGSRQGEGPGGSRNWGTSRPVCLRPTDELLSSNFLVTKRGGCLVFSPGAFPYVLDGGSAVRGQHAGEISGRDKGDGQRMWGNRCCPGQPAAGAPDHLLGCGLERSVLVFQTGKRYTQTEVKPPSPGGASCGLSTAGARCHQRGNAWAHFREELCVVSRFDVFIGQRTGSRSSGRGRGRSELAAAQGAWRGTRSQDRGVMT